MCVCMCVCVRGGGVCVWHHSSGGDLPFTLLECRRTQPQREDVYVITPKMQIISQFQAKQVISAYLDTKMSNKGDL